MKIASSKKILNKILILLLILFIYLFVFFKTNLKNGFTIKIGNIVTYVHYKNRYLIQYPVNKFIRLDCPKEDFILTPRLDNNSTNTLFLETCDRSGRYDLEIVTVDINKKNTLPKTDEYFRVGKEEIIIGGINAIKYQITQIKERETGDWAREIITFDHSGKNYTIYLNYGLDSNDQLLPVIKTFKFLN